MVRKMRSVDGGKSLNYSSQFLLDRFGKPISFPVEE
jgi:hypothetical protein